MNARRRPSRRGVALILVLGFIALLSLLITALLETLRVRLIEGEARAQRASLRLDAESALAVMRARLAVFESDASVSVNPGRPATQPNTYPMSRP